MNALEEFRLALARGESQIVEFSSDASHSHILQTISAFANTRGGVIYVGVDERPEAEGVDNGIRINPVITGAAPETIDRIVSNLAQHFDDPLPKVSTSILADRGPNGNVIAISVSRHSGKDKIALADLSIWRRRGKHNETIQARARPNRNPIKAQEADAIKFREHVSATVIRKQDGAENSADPAKEARDAEQPFRDRSSIEELTGTEPAASPDQVVDSNRGDGEDGNISAVDSAAQRQIGTRAVFSREASDEELALNADDYAELIAQLLASASHRERMSFALFGHWGRGKSYLAGRVIRSLEDANIKYATVSYSAWKWSAPQNLIHVL
jgi:hypothetical protein